MFRTFPLSIIRSFPLYTQHWCMAYSLADSLLAGSGYSILILLESCLQTCMTYTSAVCTVENSWWWTEELSETYRISFLNKNFWEISVSSWFYYKKFITMRGHMNITMRGHMNITHIYFRTLFATSKCCNRAACRWRLSGYYVHGTALLFTCCSEG
jgi:hypothetical protein